MKNNNNNMKINLLDMQNYIVLKNQVICENQFAKTIHFDFMRLKHKHYVDSLYTIFVYFSDESNAKLSKIMNKDVMNQDSCRLVISQYEESIREQISTAKNVKPFVGILKDKTNITSQEYIKVRKDEAKL